MGHFQLSSVPMADGARGATTSAVFVLGPQAEEMVFGMGFEGYVGVCQVGVSGTAAVKV